MKTFTAPIASFFIALLFMGFKFTTSPKDTYGFEIPEGYVVSDHWFSTWQNTMGSAPAEWMLNEASEADWVLEAKDGSGFIIVRIEQGFSDLDEFAEEFETGFFDGKGTRLISPLPAEFPAESSCSIDLAGTISGKQAVVRKIMIANMDGSSFQISQVNPTHAYQPEFIPASQIAASIDFSMDAPVYAKK